MIEITYSTVPVSYTHLDVYKRQLRTLCIHFDIESIHPRLVFCYNVFDEFWMTQACSKSSWLMLTRFSFWLLDNKCDMNFAEMRCMISFPIKILSHEPKLKPNSSAPISLTVKWQSPHIIVRTSSILSSLIDVEGRPGLGFSLVDVLPTLKWINQS